MKHRILHKAAFEDKVFTTTNLSSFEQTPKNTFRLEITYYS